MVSTIHYDHSAKDKSSLILIKFFSSLFRIARYLLSVRERWDRQNMAERPAQHHEQQQGKLNTAEGVFGEPHRRPCIRCEANEV